VSAGTIVRYRSGTSAGHDGFARLMWAEWTKLWTVRGWVVGIVVAGLLTVGIGLLSHSECGSQASAGAPVVMGGPGCTRPLGPGGEAVTDGFYFVHQSLADDGSITARVTSMTGSSSPNGASAQDLHAGVQPWSKAGIMIKASDTAGSAYAAMMVTGGHGVRMQWNFTGDAAGLAGAVSGASPRWLRLTRSGDTITGYDSPDGTAWTRVGTVTLAGLPSAAPAGLFVASPDVAQVTSRSIGGGSGTGGPSQATAVFDRVALTRSGGAGAGGAGAGGAGAGGAGAGGAGSGGAGSGGAWTGTAVGGRLSGPYPVLGYRQSGSGLVVTGSGDIAPVVDPGAGSIANTQVGTFAGLIVVVIVAAMFITAEYRRGLIRVTLTASPRRGRVLAAKAIVIGGAAFAVGFPAAVAALLIQEPLARSRGIFIDPVSVLTQVRVLAGTALLLAVAAVLALALGALLRRGAIAVTAVIAVIVLPYFFAVPLAVLPAGAADWLLRITPAAGFAIQQPYPAYPQVTGSYTPGNGYYPLAPWAGFAVLCAWTALALGLAVYLLRRRDA
jgi:ABC-type transport system involved in multi-copper enzyme maturation permease subunit